MVRADGNLALSTLGGSACGERTLQPMRDSYSVWEETAVPAFVIGVFVSGAVP